MNMNNLIERINVCETREEMLELVVEVAKLMGFEYISIGFKQFFSFSEPDVEIVSNFPQEWINDYVEQNYILIDPIITRAIHTQKPVIWKDMYFVNTPEILESVKKSNIQQAWTFAIGNLTGGVAYMTLARTHTEITPELPAQQLASLTAVLHFAHERLLFITDLSYNSEKGQARRLQLTSREIEILRFTADGNTSAEIATKLSISERTVNFHINNILIRLNVSNKTAAVARAISQGLLY